MVFLFESRSYLEKEEPCVSNTRIMRLNRHFSSDLYARQTPQIDLTTQRRARKQDMSIRHHTSCLHIHTHKKQTHTHSPSLSLRHVELDESQKKHWLTALPRTLKQ